MAKLPLHRSLCPTRRRRAPICVNSSTAAAHIVSNAPVTTDANVIAYAEGRANYFVAALPRNLTYVLAPGERERSDRRTEHR